MLLQLEVWNVKAISEILKYNTLLNAIENSHTSMLWNVLMYLKSNSTINVMLLLFSKSTWLWCSWACVASHCGCCALYVWTGKKVACIVACWICRCNKDFPNALIETKTCIFLKINSIQVFELCDIDLPYFHQKYKDAFFFKEKRYKLHRFSYC